MSILSIESIDDAISLYHTIHYLITLTLSSSSLELLAQVLDDNNNIINPKLKNLIGQIISSKIDQWIDACHSSRPSLPSYIDVDWNIRIKKSSNDINIMNVPIAIIQLKIDNNHNNGIPTTLIDSNNSSSNSNSSGSSSNSNNLINIKKVDFELSKEALGTMLDGLGKIRDQLSLMKS